MTGPESQRRLGKGRPFPLGAVLRCELAFAPWSERQDVLLRARMSGTLSAFDSKKQMLGNESQLPEHCWAAHVLVYGEMGKTRPAKTDVVSQ